MDNPGKSYTNSLGRHLSNLKLISRLLGHELHNQGGSKAITLSRDEVLEIQTTIDLFIEEASKRSGGKPSTGSLSTGGTLPGGTNLSGAGLSGAEGPLLPTRN